ncbi:MAG: hypothetical protein ACOC4G_08405, partial [Bacillota bacterium]
MKRYLFLLILFLILTLVSVEGKALDAGGEIETYFTGILYDDNNLYTNLTEKLNLELFIPVYGNTESRVEFDFVNSSDSNINNSFYTDSGGLHVKKLYIKHRSNKYNLTAGRQPISWSFGSLINPVDF